MVVILICDIVHDKSTCQILQDMLNRARRIIEMIFYFALILLLPKSDRLITTTATSSSWPLVIFNRENIQRIRFKFHQPGWWFQTISLISVMVIRPYLVWIQGDFFNWASPEFAKCWLECNWFQKNVRVPDWPPFLWNSKNAGQFWMTLLQMSLWTNINSLQHLM